MLNPLKYAEDFKQLGLNEAEQRVVLDYFHQLGEILFNNKCKNIFDDGLQR